jgi:hypothetical protein
MKIDTSQLIDTAINNLWLRRRYVADEITIDLALLVREADQKTNECYLVERKTGINNWS